MVPVSTKTPVKRANQTLAITPKTGKLSLVSRKVFHLLVHFIQLDGDKEIYSRPLKAFLKGIDFNSNDTVIVKSALKSLMDTPIIWNTSIGGGGKESSDEVWISEVTSRLVSEIAILENGKGSDVIIEWSLAPKLRAQLLSPERFTIFNYYYFQIKSNATLILFEIIERYKTNPTRRTINQPWQWWLITLAVKNTEMKYQYFKRDILLKAVDELNLLVKEYRIELLEHRDGDKRKVTNIQFLIIDNVQNQEKLPDTETSVNANLLSQLVDMGLKEKEAKTVISNYEEDYIIRTLVLVRQRLTNTNLNPIKNVSGYLKTALLDGYAMVGPTLSSPTSSILSPVLGHTQTISPPDKKYPSTILQLFNVSRSKKALEEFNMSTEVRKKSYIENYFETCPNVTIQSAYKKNGLKSSVFKQAFFEWLSTYLWAQPSPQELQAFADSMKVTDV